MKNKARDEEAFRAINLADAAYCKARNDFITHRIDEIAFAKARAIHDEACAAYNAILNKGEE